MFASKTELPRKNNIYCNIVTLSVFSFSNMYKSIASFVIVILAGATARGEDPTTTTPQPQPVYKPQPQPPAYAPHQNYPYSDGYGGYDGFFYPLFSAVQPQAYPGQQQQTQSNYVPAVIPAAQVNVSLA